MDTTKLTGVIPASVLTQIPDVMIKFEINTPLRLAHFLAQCAHESSNFKLTEENLNYSAAGLLKIFPKYFTSESAILYAHQPVKIASKVYGNRMGNGPESSQEGFLYRGRGYIQITGKNNYTLFGAAIGEDTVTNPELIATKYPLISGAWFFKSHGLLPICDTGDSIAAITAVTRNVNGGTIGLSDRIAQFKKFYPLLA